MEPVKNETKVNLPTTEVAADGKDEKPKAEGKEGFGDEAKDGEVDGEYLKPNWD